MDTKHSGTTPRVEPVPRMDEAKKQRDSERIVSGLIINRFTNKEPVDYLPVNARYQGNFVPTTVMLRTTGSPRAISLTSLGQLLPSQR